MDDAQSDIIGVVDSALELRLEAELNEAQSNLLRLIRLIVDIEYHAKYEGIIED